MVSAVVSCPTNSLGTKEASAALQASGGDRGFLALGCWSFGLLFGSGYLLGRLRLNEAVQMAALRSSGCRLLQWLLASATVVQNMCVFLGGNLVAQAGVNPLCLLWLLSLLSNLQVPVMCQPVSASIYPLSVCICDNFACYSHGHLS